MDKADQLVESYSHGMRQKLALAGAMLHEPQVLFLDEPTSGLDPRAARLVKDLLLGLVTRGHTVFLSTHVLEIAEQLCHRVGIINQGQIVARGTLAELRTQAQREAGLARGHLPATDGRWRRARSGRVPARQARAHLLRLLIGVRARQAWNRVVRGKRRSLRVLGTVVGTSFGIAFMAIVGLNTSLVVDRVARVDADAAREALPALLIGTTLLALVTSMGVAFHHLFMAGDQELLMAAPVRLRDLFALKVVETWRDGLHVVFLQIATLIGFGLALRLPPTYHVLAVSRRARADRGRGDDWRRRDVAFRAGPLRRVAARDQRDW